MTPQSQRQDSEYGSEPRTISEAEIKILAREAAEMTVANLFEIFGIDVSSKDGRKGLQDDLSWLREARVGTTAMRKAGWGAAIATLVTAAAYAVWKGILVLAGTVAK